MVSRLVKEKELDINAQDMYGNTVAYFACAKGFTEWNYNESKSMLSKLFETL